MELLWSWNITLSCRGKRKKEEKKNGVVVKLISYISLACMSLLYSELKRRRKKVQIFPLPTTDPLCSAYKVWHHCTNLSCGFHPHVSEMIQFECRQFQLLEK